MGDGDEGQQHHYQQQRLARLGEKGVSRSYSKAELLKKRCGVSEDYMKSSKALLRLGVSEEDVENAQRLVGAVAMDRSQGDPTSDADKASRLLGASNGQRARAKALTRLGVTEQHIQTDLELTLSSLGNGNSPVVRHELRRHRSCTEPDMTSSKRPWNSKLNRALSSVGILNEAPSGTFSASRHVVQTPLASPPTEAMRNASGAF